MLRFQVAIVGLLLQCLCATAQEGQDEKGAAIELFDGKSLQGLVTYVADPSVNPNTMWKVEDGMLRATGVGTGYVRTEMAYSDYKLRLEWRWPEAAGNSGVLVNVVDGDKLWPKSFECQLKSGAAGDFASFMDARSNEEIVSRNPQGVSTGRLPRPGPSQEKPLGEWNTYEITVAGGTITLVVNGVEANRMTGCNPSAGMIAFQTEGAPIDFRNITLTPLPPAKDMHAPMPK